MPPTSRILPTPPSTCGMRQQRSKGTNRSSSNNNNSGNNLNLFFSPLQSNCRHRIRSEQVEEEEESHPPKQTWRKKPTENNISPFGTRTRSITRKMLAKKLNNLSRIQLAGAASKTAQRVALQISGAIQPQAVDPKSV